MKRIHMLKTWPSYWHAVKDGTKTFEVRRNDRDFAVGDELALCLWDPHHEAYVRPEGATPFTCQPGFADKIRCEITYVLPGGQWGIAKGYCVLGIRSLDP